jgi:hypothetical protein
MKVIKQIKNFIKAWLYFTAIYLTAIINLMPAVFFAVFFVDF